MAVLAMAGLEVVEEVATVLMAVRAAAMRAAAVWVAAVLAATTCW